MNDLHSKDVQAALLRRKTDKQLLWEAEDRLLVWKSWCIGFAVGFAILMVFEVMR